MSRFRTEWRDCKEWSNFGLPMSTTNNEACKLYDASLSQYVGWYDDPSLGGLEPTLKKMLDADPDFVMGHAMSIGLDLMATGHTMNLDAEFGLEIYNMAALAEKQKITEREKKHVLAVKLCAEGEMSRAAVVWENILMDHPLDLLALKFCHDSYFYLGYQPQMRDSVARVLPHWKPTMPLYGYLLGMHSFGLEETNLYEQAEKTARKSLEINPSDAWATHTMAHVMEMMGRQDEGISFMKGTVNDWAGCGMLACHNFWHLALYSIEKGKYEDALAIFDSEVSPRATKSGAMLDIVDLCSMLWRFEMEGVNVEDRWQATFETCRPHLHDHIMAFNDIHFLMACLGAKKTDATAEMMNSLKDFVRNGRGTNKCVTAEVGQPLCESFALYSAGDYAKAVDTLYPLRYQVIKIGGSNAQRDIFNQFLIHACLKSPLKEHNNIGRVMLMERKALKSCAPLTDRLILKAMAVH
ncbi:hypothetical protein ScPMuIL_007718 [Solemya velum]